jgi:hypothetical protein
MQRLTLLSRRTNEIYEMSFPSGSTIRNREYFRNFVSEITGEHPNNLVFLSDTRVRGEDLTDYSHGLPSNPYTAAGYNA